MKERSNKLKSLMMFLTALFIGHSMTGQISGVKYIPGDYPTIASAIGAINALGVGRDGVAFHIAANYTETFQNLTDGLITATGTAEDQIAFRKAGRGNNPLITAASPGVGNFDYVFCLAGSDYITFDGIDVQENPLNLDNTQKMEYAFALMRTSGTNGSQHNIIKNSTLTLSSNPNAYGINVVNWNYLAPGTPLAVTDVRGTNSYNKFYNLNFVNCYSGINLTGFDDTIVPFAFYDQGNEVGKDGQNTFTGLGTGGTTVYTYGINATAQNDLELANNLFTGSVDLTTGRIYAMNLLSASNANLDVYGNTVSIEMTNTGMFYGIYINNFGKDGTTNTINIYNNVISNNTFLNHTSGNVVYLYAWSSALNLNCYGNIVTNNSVGSPVANSSGLIYYIYMQNMRPTGLAQTGTMNVNNNIITQNQRRSTNTTAGPLVNFLLTTGQTKILNLHDNLISNNIAYSYLGNCFGITNAHIGNEKYIFNNIVENISGTVYSFTALHNANGPNTHIYNNRIRNISLANTFLGIGQIKGIQHNSANSIVYIYNNFISELYVRDGKTPGNVIGFYSGIGSFIGFYNNTIYLDGTSTEANFGSQGIWIDPSSPPLDLRNNLVINKTIPTGVGVSTIIRNGGSVLGNYALTSGNNNYYTDGSKAEHIIYLSPSDTIKDIEAFKTFVFPRETNSFSENTAFINVTSLPYDLHVDVSEATLCESGGTILTTPINITTDFDNQPRFPNPGYPNNPLSPATAPDVGADEFAGMNHATIPQHIVLNGQLDACYDAMETITITNANVEAGDLAEFKAGISIEATLFDIFNGGTADLKAGSAIFLGEGLHIASGASFHAGIMTSISYCTKATSIISTRDQQTTPANIIFPAKAGTMFEVFPNPTTGQVNFHLKQVEESDTVTFEILGMMGERLLIEKLPLRKTFMFDLSGYPKGIYLVRVMVDNQTGVEKLIIH